MKPCKENIYMLLLFNNCNLVTIKVTCHYQVTRKHDRIVISRFYRGITRKMRVYLTVTQIYEGQFFYAFLKWKGGNERLIITGNSDIDI